MFGQSGVIGLMIFTALGALVAIFAINPDRIDHKVARGLTKDDGQSGPSGFSALAKTRGLILLAVLMLIFHWGHAPMSRLIAAVLDRDRYAVPYDGNHHRHRAVHHDPRGGQRTVPDLALWAQGGVSPSASALPVRGLLAGSFSHFWVVFPVQILDGVGAGLLGIVTPVAVQRLLNGTGRFNVGFAAVMTVQGIGASLSNVMAGWLATEGGYGLSNYFGGGIAIIAVAMFLVLRGEIVPHSEEAIAERRQR